MAKFVVEYQTTKDRLVGRHGAEGASLTGIGSPLHR